MTRILKYLLLSVLVSSVSHGASIRGDSIVLRKATLPSNPADGELAIDTTDGKLKQYSSSSSAWGMIAGGSSGGSSGKNYFSDTEAEQAAKFTSYNNPGAVPTTGSGGTVIGTSCGVTSTNPLSGTKSYYISKNNAASSQGDGCAFQTDTTLDSVNAGKQMVVRFNYKPEAASTYNSQLKAYIYHIGSNKLEECNGLGRTGTTTSVLSALPGENAIHSCLFTQEPIDTAIRVILHQHTTLATLFGLLVDRPIVGELATSIAPPVATEWVQFTPTWTASTTNPSIGNGSLDGKWRRVGDSAEIMLRMIAGSTTSYGSGSYRFGLPSGLQIDTSKIVGSYSTISRPVGVGTAIRSGVNTFILTVQATNANYVQAMIGNVTNDVTNTNPATWANGDEITLNFTVPIVGWTTGSNSFNSTDIEIRGALLKRNANASQSIANSTTTKLQYTGADKDNLGGWDNTNHRYYFKSSGTYLLNVYHTFQLGASGSVPGALHLYLNGSAQFTSYRPDTLTANKSGSYGNGNPVQLSEVITVNAGDYIEIWGEQYSGSTVTSNVGRLSIAQLPDLKMLANIGSPIFELLTSTSSTSAVSTANTFHSLTGNSITLTPGTWELTGNIYFGNNGTSPSYTRFDGGWFGANGTNTITSPAGIGTLSGASVISGTLGSMLLNQSNTADGSIRPETIIIKLTQTQTVYLVPFSNATTIANARITTLINAKRIK